MITLKCRFWEAHKYSWVAYFFRSRAGWWLVPHSSFSPLLPSQVAARHNLEGRWPIPPAARLGHSPVPSCGRMETQASQGQLGAEGDCGMSSLLVPSPQSEAVTHEMEELSLQPTLPPLSERKNGEDMLLCGPVGFSLWLWSTATPRIVNFWASQIKEFDELCWFSASFKFCFQ